MRQFFIIIYIFLSSLLFAQVSLEGKIFKDDSNFPLIRYRVTFKYSIMTYSKSYYEGDEFIRTTILEDHFRISETSHLTFIEFGPDFGNKWLCIYSDEIILLYKDDGDYFFKGHNANIKDNWDNLFFDDRYFSTDSFLKEQTKNGTIEYTEKNLFIESIPKPWVEGEEAYGIGVKINSPIINDPSSGERFLTISNGYVSYRRPELYEMNSRVKTIRIRDIESGKLKDVTIPDSPNMFRIPLYDTITRGGIEIVILDVYKGTRFKDTCINFMGIIDMIGIF